MIRKSFTLIEVLVALVILGILSTFIIISLNSVVDSANDAKRKKDLDSISKGLMVYRNLSGVYPTGSDCDIGDGTCLNELIEAGYATTFPIDPSGSRYKYTSDGTTYTIKATLSSNQTLSYSPDAGYSQYAGLAGWTKRKSITVSNSGSSLTNYQLKFTVNRSSGTDSGFNVYVGNNCQSDYRDIRFTNSSNSVLNYWIESSDSNIATIWVEADSLPSGNTTMYLYYDNSSAVSASNGTNTFPFFDDFSGASIDAAKWDTTGTVVVDSSSAKVGAASAGLSNIRGKTSFEEGYVARYRANIPSTTASQNGAGFCNIVAGGGLDNAVGYFDAWDAHSAFIYNTVNNRASVSNSYLAAYQIYDVFRKGSGYSQLNINGGVIVANQASSYITSKPFCARVYDAGKYLYIDWVLIRKYTATEPTIPLWGEEETI